MNDRTGELNRREFFFRSGLLTLLAGFGFKLSPAYSVGVDPAIGESFKAVQVYSLTRRAYLAEAVCSIYNQSPTITALL